MACWLYFVHAVIRSNNSDCAESGRFEVFSFVKFETLFFVRR
jgi:hypothetical protein